MALRRIIRPSAEAVSTTEPSASDILGRDVSPGLSVPLTYEPAQEPVQPPTPQVWHEQVHRQVEELVGPDISFGSAMPPPPSRVIVTDVLPPGALVAVNDAARLAGISRRTMYYWIAKGLVRTSRVASGRLRVEVASLFKETAA